MNHVGVSKRMAVILACEASDAAGWVEFACVWLFGARWTLEIDDDVHRLAKWRGRFYHLRQVKGPVLPC